MKQRMVKMTEKYPIASFEDPFDQDDFTSYGALTEAVKSRGV